MSEFDADAFAAIATGDDPVVDEETTSTENHAAAEGTPEDNDVGSKSTLREMLMNDQPEMSLEDVEDPWDPERGGTTRIYRGMKKATGFEGTPALVDAVIGTVEVVHTLRDGLSSSSSTSSDDDQEDVDDDGGSIGGVPSA